MNLLHLVLTLGVRWTAHVFHLKIFPHGGHVDNIKVMPYYVQLTLKKNRCRSSSVLTDLNINQSKLIRAPTDTLD